MWKLWVSVGSYADGQRRRFLRTVKADSEIEATRALAEFVAEIQSGPLTDHKQAFGATVNEAMEQFLTEHLLEEKGREPTVTVRAVVQSEP